MPEARDDPPQPMGRALDAEWLAWLDTNLARGCAREELRRILREHGFAADAIERAMTPLVRGASITTNPLASGGITVTLRSAARLSGAQSPTPARVPRLKRLPCDALEIYLAEDFFDEAECRHVIECMRGHLRESTITAPGEPDRYFRVSQTCDLGQIDDPGLRNLDARICAALGTTEAFAEPTQGQHYDVGGEFKAHTDTFEAHELSRFMTPTLGQRSWTFMVYLNDVAEGGETQFVRAGLTVKPRRGMAVIWNSLSPDGEPNPASLHHGMPVKRGVKDIVTKWFRVAR